MGRTGSPAAGQAVISRRPSLIFMCLLATWIGWGSTYLAIKFALLSFPPLFQVGSRFVVAGGLLLTWAWWHGRQMPTRIQWRNAAIIGAVMMGGTVGGATFAEQWVASGLVVAFMAVIPALMTLANLPFGIKPSRLEVAGMTIGFVGVLLLVRGAGFSASPQGLIAVAVSVVSFSIGSILSQRKFPLAPRSAGYGSGLICAGVLLLALSASAREVLQWPPKPLAIAAWWYLVLIGSVTAFSAYMTLLSSTSAAVASSWTFVTPVIGMLLGFSLGNEIVTGGEWSAVCVITLGVILLVLGRSTGKVVHLATRRPLGYKKSRM
jgi:drug/metabolite transporter (DMT)-like permease